MSQCSQEGPNGELHPGVLLHLFEEDVAARPVLVEGQFPGAGALQLAVLADWVDQAGAEELHQIGDIREHYLFEPGRRDLGPFQLGSVLWKVPYSIDSQFHL